MPHFDALKMYSCGKHCSKQFLLYSQSFLPYMAHIFYFRCTLKCRLQFILILDRSEILLSGNGLTFGMLTKRHKNGHFLLSDKDEILKLQCCFSLLNSVDSGSDFTKHAI